jgi:hypothetical protein
MRKTISIKGGPPVEVDLDDIALHEAIAVEEATGWTVSELATRLKSESMLAFAGLLWLVLKFRLGEDVTFTQLRTGEYHLSMKNDVVIADVEDGEAAGPTGGSEATLSP